MAILEARRRLPFRRWFRHCASASSFCPCSSSAALRSYLFVPLAEAVIFAMLASYILSRTLVPTLAMYLLKAQAARWSGSHAIRLRVSSEDSKRLFERIRACL